MKDDAAWLRAMGKTLLRMSEQPERRADNDVYTALRGLAFDCAAMALVVEDSERVYSSPDEFLAEQPTQPIAERTRAGFNPAKGT